jgi:hypothetical protein
LEEIPNLFLLGELPMLIDTRSNTRPQMRINKVNTFKESDTKKVSSLLGIFTVAAIVATMFVMSGFIH